MIKKYAILLGVVLSLLLLYIATLHYPGGSQNDLNSIGFDWRHNYLSNLFGVKAENGTENSAKPWAIAGMLLLCCSLAIFFLDFSKKITSRKVANIIKYTGVSAMVFSFLIVTPLHDQMMPLVSTLGLISCFYITVLVFKSKLTGLKILSALFLLLFYACTFVYFTHNFLEYLPILQKAGLFIVVAWVLALTYFSGEEDFQHTK